MITYKFQCLKCGYKFTAIQPLELYEACDKCLMCKSKKFVKKIIKPSIKSQPA
ncbi:hypothetical protein LCGC14_1598550 [marine sediment metagenome]|uniref:Uncharacterized protein n=1 Tax=marine sediment metagenome TaxID=412755 RepID=A0A0F9KSK3_9ZZZZ